ncbi:MAG: rhodanese-like domain-containing protein [Bacteroidales bacterium]|nr:rhodanese-like domain-containing protein [Bacteroidales bacterium]
MKKLKYLSLLLMFPLLLSNCTHVDTQVYASVDELVAEHKADVNYATVQQLDELLISGTPGVKVVDVREPEEFAAGHIPGAINVPRGLLEFSSQLTNRREKLYVYSNQQNRSTLAASNLELLKFGHVTVLDGGMDAWALAFPEKIEEGSGTASAATPAKKASSGGCGD